MSRRNAGRLARSAIALLAMLAGCAAVGSLPEISEIIGLAEDADCDGIGDQSDTCSATAAGAAVDPQGCSAAQLPESRRIRVPATHGVIVEPYVASLSGTGTRLVGPFDVADNAGTAEIDGLTPDVDLYERVDWEEIGRVLFRGLAAGNDRLYLVWFYCTPEHGVSTLYYIGTDVYLDPGGTRMVSEAPQGGAQCVCADTPHDTVVDLPALDMPWPQIASGYAVTAAGLSFEDDGSGRIVVDGRELVVFPISYVDCTECPPAPGWLELHVLLWDADAGRLCIGTLYGLPQDDGSYTVELQRTICLPDLETVEELYGEYAADAAVWTAPASE